MKIGIITHHYIKNYGAFWQAYALQETLKKLFPNYDVYIINYKNKKHFISNARHFFIRKPYKCSLFKNIYLYIDGIKQFIGFTKFSKLLRLSKIMKSASDINKNQFDIVVIGSDEVWNTDSVGADKIKFGIGLQAKKIVAYAASGGSVDANSQVPNFVISGLKNFSSISVRDYSTESLVYKYLGFDPIIVLDPTLLTEIPFSIPIKYRKIINRNYILVYYANLPDKHIKEIKKFAKDNDLIIVGAGHFEKWFDYSLIDINPLEWNYLFKKAKYVITGTFHGTIFSIIHSKLFCVYPTSSNRVKKVHSLLTQLSLMERILDKQSNIIEVLNTPIDYSLVHSKLDEMRVLSLEFLKNSLM